MFQGFTQETFAFFAALQFNNNRDFFEENRPIYEKHVKAPLVALSEALAPTVQSIDPLLDIRPSRVVSRIHRDLRFRKDKTPYREYMWIGYRRVGETREETCGFYFDLSSSQAHWGCGFFHMQHEVMASFRKKLVAEPKRVQKILKAPAFAASFKIEGDAYVRQYQPPEGMPAELGALYRKKSLYAEHAVADMNSLLSARLADEIAEGYRALAPFYALQRECMVKKIEGETV